LRQSRTSQGTAVKYNEEFSRRVLAEACEEVGIDPGEPKLLRHQTNAVYLLNTVPVVARVAHPQYGVSHIREMVRLVRWLVGVDFPTVALHEVQQPVIIDGLPVTFWKYIPQDREVSAADLAAPLRILHDLTEPAASAPVLPKLDAIAAIRYSLARGRPVLSDREHEYLQSRCDELETNLGKTVFHGEPRVIHGDAQHRNALWDGDHAVLCDWDSAAVGPVEWDLVTIEIHCRRFQHPAGTYEEFSRIYGMDVRDWDGFTAMRDIRELRMITTNARKSAPGSPAANEVHRRVALLEDGAQLEPWSII
jgi:hypothetical protein